MATAGGGNFLQLISAAFVDSRVRTAGLWTTEYRLLTANSGLWSTDYGPGTRDSYPTSRVQKAAVVKHRCSLFAECWTSGQLVPKDDFSVCCIIKKSFSLFATAPFSVPCIIFLLPFLMHLVCGWEVIALGCQRGLEGGEKVSGWMGIGWGDRKSWDYESWTCQGRCLCLTSLSLSRLPFSGIF